MTVNVKQVQQLLAYLGYSPGEADGIAGAKTNAACLSFQKDFGIKQTGKADASTFKALKKAVYKDWTRPAASFWKDIRYFTREEFACKCGKCGGFPVEPEELLVRTEDKVRAHFGKPAKNSSGVRCAAHNAAVGGKSGSRHKLGKAVDFCIPGVSASKIDAYVGSLPEVRYHYCIDGSFVHMDIE